MRLSPFTNHSIIPTQDGPKSKPLPIEYRVIIDVDTGIEIR